MEKEENVLWTVYSFEGDSILITKDKKLRSKTIRTSENKM